MSYFQTKSLRTLDRVKTAGQKFWAWYERNYTFNIALASLLFLLQLIHLYWLTTNVVAFKLTSQSFFQPSKFWELVLILVDYVEIPALITTSLVYLNELRKKINWKAVWFLLFLNSQWLHIFWITDEFAVKTFVSYSTQVYFLQPLFSHRFFSIIAASSLMPLWLAWLAIFIDYLELPVIFDTLKKFSAALYAKRVKEFLVKELKT